MSALHVERCHAHVRKRAWRRFGWALSAPEIASLEASLRDGGDQVLGRQPDGRELRRILLRGQWLVVVFDPRLDCAVTLLPPGWRQ